MSKQTILVESCQPTGFFIESIDDRHVADLQQILNEPEVSVPLNFPTPFPDDGAARFVAERRRAWKDRSAYTFAIMDHGHSVGACSIRQVPPPAYGWELGFFISKPYWRRGYAMAAVENLLAFSRNRKIKEVIALCQVDNQASICLLNKLGFSQPLLVVQGAEGQMAKSFYWFWKELY